MLGSRKKPHFARNNIQSKRSSGAECKDSKKEPGTGIQKSPLYTQYHNITWSLEALGWDKNAKPHTLPTTPLDWQEAMEPGVTSSKSLPYAQHHFYRQHHLTLSKAQCQSSRTSIHSCYQRLRRIAEVGVKSIVPQHEFSTYRTRHIIYHNILKRACV